MRRLDLSVIVRRDYSSQRERTEELAQNMSERAYPSQTHRTYRDTACRTHAPSQDHSEVMVSKVLGGLLDELVRRHTVSGGGEADGDRWPATVVATVVATAVTVIVPR